MSERLSAVFFDDNADEEEEEEEEVEEEEERDRVGLGTFSIVFSLSIDMKSATRLSKYVSLLAFLFPLAARSAFFL